MQTSPKTRIFIDGANLYKGMKSDIHELDYARFARYLKDKYRPEVIYIFIGYVESQKPLYEYLTKCGYQLIFKETLQQKNGEIKGNVDAELVIQSLEDFYEINYEQGILVSGDGDFACLIDFWQRKDVTPRVLAPNKKYCSYFLRKLKISLTYLDDPVIFENIKKDPQ